MARRLSHAAVGVALALLLGNAPALAQTSQTPAEISKVAIAEIKKHDQAGDFTAARTVAEATAKAFAGAGEKYWAATYTLIAIEEDAQMNNWARINELYGAKVDAILADIDSGNESEGTRFLHVIGYMKAMTGDRAGQVKYNDLYIERVTKAEGADSERALMAPLDVAVMQIKTGDVEGGYQRAIPALEKLAASNLHGLTMARFDEVAQALWNARRGDLAEQVFATGVQTVAAQQFIGETSKFYAGYARYMAAGTDAQAKLRSYELFEAAINISRQIGDQPTTLALLNEYAITLNNTGASGKALTLMEDIISSAEELYGDSDDRTLDAYSNYSEILRNFGAPANAADADMDVYTKRLARSGEKDEKVLAAANGLGQEYLTLQNYDEARKYFEISRKLAAYSEHRQNIEANSDGWLLLTDVLAGRRAQDDDVQSRLVAIADGAEYAPILRIKAAMSASTGMVERNQPEPAFNLLERARKVSIDRFTADHPLSFELERLMVRAVATTRPDYAATYYAELSEAMFGWMDVQSRLTNDIAVAELLRGHADALLSDFLDFAKTNDAAKSYFVMAAFRWKALVGGAASTIYRRAEAQLKPDDEETRSAIRNALRLDAQVAAVMSSFRNDGETGDLVRRRGEAVAVMMQRLQALGIAVEGTEATFDMRQDLKPGDAMVNYFVTRRWGPDRLAKDAITEQKLHAVVTTADGRSQIIELGDPRNVAKIGSETQIASLRGTRGAVPLLDVKKPFVELYDQLVRPLEPALSDVKTIYVVPDGDLFSMPFSMLRDGKDELLEDRFTVRILTTPDAIIGANQRPGLEPNSATVLVGDVDYRKGAEKGAEPLPATGIEIAAIGKLAKSRGDAVETLTGAVATEAELRQKIASAKVVHLATHGSFGEQTNQGAASADTLWQSEIVLANSGDEQKRTRDGNDGRLYAFEVMDWDLSKLDLLVLSACETGRGEQSFLTGLRGLPTALGIAGARRSLLTLWPVDDAGTANFMIRYYEHLDAGQSYAEALRTTRREAREGKVDAASDPRVWAAFVLFEG